MATSEQREQEQESGSLLMRFFESEFFDAWIAVSYLHKDLSPKTREYLCERIYMLPESEVESYVSQLCQLYVSRQGHEEVGKLLVDLCANSLNIAVKIYWILLAISQDRPHDEAIIQLRDRCELAGLSGHWDLPFKDTALPAPMPRRMNRFLRHSANGVYSADKWSSGQIDPMGASPDGYMERRYSAHSNHDFLGGRESRSISPDGLGAGLFSSVFVDTGVEGLIYESGPHVNDGQSGHKAIRAQEPGSRLNESIESLRSDSSSVTHLVSSKTSPLTLVEAPSSPKRRETTFGATLDFVEALCSASSYLTSFSEEERQWALHKSLRNINVEIDRASSAGVAIWFPMTRAAPQRVIRLAYRESRLLNSREKAPFTLYVEVLNEETSVLEAEGILSPGGGIMDPSRAVSAELDKDTLRSLSRNLDSETFGFNVKAAAEEAAAAGIAWVPQHHRRNSSHDISSSNLASIALAAVKGSSAAEKSHLPPVAPNDSLQLTPSVASQKSDASVLAAELSLADFACDSRDGSPSSHISKLGSSDSEIDRGMVNQSVKHLPRLAVQGGGTWIGGISQNPENRYGPHKIVSSPRIQDAMDQIRGEDVAPVSLIIHVFDPKSTVPPKMCTNSGLLCRIGICQCPHAPKQRKLDEDASEDKLVRIELRLKPGLDLTVKPPNSSKHRRMPSREALLQVAKQHKLPPPVIMATIESTTEYDGADSDLKKQGELEKAQEVYGEKWEDRKERIRRKSPHGNRPGWDLRCVIVKSGDDCRQELLSMQLIRTFHSIFLEAGLPLWLRPYEVLVTSNLTALIEMVPNAPSIHQVKSSFSNQNKSLKDHFMIMYGRNTPEFELAQNNFVESMAAYSLVCYLLQIRDRHNGNLLLDNEGHIIHIDFGFMLSNSPGGVNFESAPFKLTRELLEIMDSDSEGTSSKSFDYFKVLMIQGFIAIRKHADRLLELVSMMSDSGCPCFKNKGMAVEGLRKRLAPGISEEALVKHVLGLIGDSLDAWRTRQYDYYQRVLNGIM